MISGFKDFVGYIDERVQCYPFMNEMTGLYKGLIEIWDKADPDDLSPLFYIREAKASPTRDSGFSSQGRGDFSRPFSGEISLFKRDKIIDIDFTNSVRTAKKIFNLVEKEKREESTANEDLSMREREAEDFIRGSLYKDERFRNIVLKWILKPSFIYSLNKIEIDASSWGVGKCPLCYSPPGMAIVDGKIQQRYLSCCFCGYRWLYHLTGCPACGNIRPERLSFFSDGSDCEQGSRAVSCEECKTYLKTVFINCRTDRRSREELDMDIEDMVTIPLDMIAHQRGYIAICQK